MTLVERIQALAAALPSDSASVTLTRADLMVLMVEGGLEGAPGTVTSTSGDLTVDEVAAEMRRATSTVRGWLIEGHLRGYKLNRRDWRVPRAALREFIDGQGQEKAMTAILAEPVDISAWRKLK